MRKSSFEERFQYEMEIRHRVAKITLYIFWILVTLALFVSALQGELSFREFIVPIGFVAYGFISGFLSRHLSHIKGFGRDSDAKQLALSLTYLNHVKRQSWPIKLATLICPFIFTIVRYVLDINNLVVLLYAPIITFCLISMKDIIVEYRIKKGLFGNNQYEARAFIEFLVEHSENIDFSDGSGNVRRALNEVTSDLKSAAAPVSGGATI